MGGQKIQKKKRMLKEEQWKATTRSRVVSRRYLPNLVQVTLHSEALDQNFKLRIAAKALRTVDKLGGLDAFLAKAKDSELGPRALLVKKQIARKALAA